MNYFLLFLLLSCQICYAQVDLTEHCQLLVVTTNDWESKQGSLQLFEKVEGEWVVASEVIPVVVGQKGMAWGIGFHALASNYALKAEGDLKAPAGIFSLGSAFGFSPNSEMVHLKVDYFPLSEFTEAVDDPQSLYYNCIVNSEEVVCDWNSSEKMRSIPLYKMGLVVNHNWPNPEPGKGSAIFLHIWRHDNSGTAGCTAMSEENLVKVLSWLDKVKNPVLIQLPLPTYSELQESWNLPALYQAAFSN